MKPQFILELGYYHPRLDFIHECSIPMYWAIHKENGANLGMFRTAGSLLDFVSKNTQYDTAYLMYQNQTIAMFMKQNNNWISV